MSTEIESARSPSTEIAPSELAVLLRINQETGRCRDRQTLLVAIARGVAGLLPTDQLVLLHAGERGAEIDVLVEDRAPLRRERDSIPDDSAAAWTMRERRALVVTSPDEIRERFPSTHAQLALQGLQSMVMVPLLRGVGCAGTIAFCSRTPRPSARCSPALLEQIGAGVAIALDNCLTHEQQQRQSHESAAMLEMNRAIGRHLHRDELFGAIAATLRGLLPTDRFGIEMPLEGELLRGHLLTPRGGKVEPTQPHVLPAEGTVCDWVLRNREWLVLGSREELRERFPVTHQVMTREQVESLCVLPLVTDERCRAALFFMATEPDAYTQVHRGLLDQVGSAVAVALDHCVALEEVRELRDKLEAENTYLQEEIRQERGFGEIVGQSPALLRALSDLERVAATGSTVLILGETGTGKELIARAIHERSARRDRPLVKVNCAAIAAGLVESELFGHVRGAFTGALADRDGRFKLADGGTIFLDEVGELPLDTQVKLLRVLQEQEFEPIGSSRTRKVDVRVIAATNRDLGAAIGEGKFRRDLFYRLNVFPLRAPPLRDRSEDIPLLAALFVDRFSKLAGKPPVVISDESIRRLRAYSWPGNIRELQNVLERAVILAGGDAAIFEQELVTLAAPEESAGAPDANRAADSLEDVERRHIRAVLERVGWVVEGERGAAKLLDLHPNTLRSRMQKLGIARPAR
jgi:formate hydrogenlyase transcriptional activator